MILKSLSLKTFCGFEKLDITLNPDFNCFIGPNGSGKTTVLQAVSLLTSSLDFGDNSDVEAPGGFKVAKVAGNRVQQFLRKNIMHIDEPNSAKTFEVAGVFEHEGQRYEVVANHQGFVKNEILDKDFWWPGIVYKSSFDFKHVTFQLRESLWPRFKKAWDAITAYPAVDPDTYTIKKLKQEGDNNYVIGFKMTKPKKGLIHTSKASQGERIIMKSLTQILNLEDERQPDIVLIDEIEQNVHYLRHLLAVEEMKQLFADKQMIVTSHSVPIIQTYQPRSHIFDVEQL